MLQVMRWSLLQGGVGGAGECVCGVFFVFVVCTVHRSEERAPTARGKPEKHLYGELVTTEL
jgi:hypothetical protein